MTTSNHGAPGGPGSEARWTDSDKSGIGTAIADTSRVWFSIARGIVTEVFHPMPDRACVRSLGLVVTNGAHFVSDEATDAIHESIAPEGIAPIARTINRCREGRYQIEKETLCDPRGSALMQRVRFLPTLETGTERNAATRLFCVLETHLGKDGSEGHAELGEHNGMPMLIARGPDGIAMALASSVPWRARSVGFVGTSDGRRDLASRGELAHAYARAENGNVSLTGEIEYAATSGTFTLAVGFGATTDDAAHAAFGALARGFDATRIAFIDEWKTWGAGLRPCRVDEREPRLWQRSASVLKTLEAKRSEGGRVAALATPWGASKGPGIDGTYHLVWTRDLVESLGALIALGARREIAPAIRYFRSTQEADGHWPQNMRMSGEAFWNNDELDETALPIVILHIVRREDLIDDATLDACWPMVQRAAAFLALHGPSTKRDRWEDVSGVTPFTIATEIVALLVAADMAERKELTVAAMFLRDLADEWNEQIDTLLYRRGGVLAEHVGVDGYYVRVRKVGEPFAELDMDHLPKTELSPDALALVRFGLRSPHDPRVVNTVRVIDAVLRTDFDGGPCFRRYPSDEYGEHADGAPFDGHGIGRPWPIFTGERAHYEIAAGHFDRARALLHTMESFASASGMLPEQVWDASDIANRKLVRGAPTGSAAPLGWAHGEYVKLCRSLMEGRVFDMPEQARARYVETSTPSRIHTWRVGARVRPVPHGKTLRIVSTRAANIEWTVGDGIPRSIRTTDSGMGAHFADIPATAGELRARVHEDAKTDESVEVTFPCDS